MKNIKWILIGVVLLGLIIFKLQSNKSTAEAKIYYYDKEKPVLVQTYTVSLASLQHDYSFSGIFEPFRETKISAESPGKINETYVETGSYVSAHDVLLKIDHSLLSLQLQAVNVQIEGLENDVNRYTVLANADAIQGVQLEKAQLGLRSAKVQRATLEEQIYKATIRAPYSGIITAQYNDIGGFAAPGVPLFQISDISILRLVIQVSERELQYFEVGKTYRISSYNDMKFVGKLIFISSRANQGNNFTIHFEVTNTKSRDLRAGMFGDVIIEHSISKAIAIPTSAIVEKDGISAVYVVENERAVLRSINLAETIGDQTLVKSGLHENDIIVKSGFINLFHNARVQITP